MRHREEEYWGQGTHVGPVLLVRVISRGGLLTEKQNWAYGPPGTNGGSNNGAGWRDTPWSRANNSNPSNPYNLGPGGVLEEIEEGGTLPANMTTNPAATVAAVTADGAAHNHYHVGSGKRHRSRSPRGFSRHYADYARARDRDGGVLELVDRERDRELDRNMVDRETANRRDLRMLALLDWERERDRAGVDVMGLLDRELDRRRDRTCGNTSAKKSRARRESGDGKEGGLEAEIEALRKDFKRLMKSPPVVRDGEGAASGGRAVGSRGTVRSAAPNIQFNHEKGKIRDREDRDPADDDDNDSDSPSPGPSGQLSRRMGRPSRKTSSTGDTSDSSGSQGS